MYAEHAVVYAEAGWPCVLPVPPGTKTPPPAGHTGAAGRDTTPADIATWAGTHADWSVALRMPDGVLGIDVDDYTKQGVIKHGAATLAYWETRLGPLPPTWASTARGSGGTPGASRIMLFRVPAGRYATRLTATHPDGTVTGDVEVIQRHHRYTVVWPSRHPAVGGAGYRWYTPDGRAAAEGVVPRPDDLAVLPDAWVAHLAGGAAAETPAAAPAVAGAALLAQLVADARPECAELAQRRLAALTQLQTADAGSRHDTATGQVYAVVQTAAAGHPGAARAIDELRVAWETLTAGETRTSEFERMLRTAAAKAVTAVGPTQVPDDPCLLMCAATAPAPRADLTEAGAEDAPLEDDRPGHPYTVIGADPFDPPAILDQPLAEAALTRLHPYQRYAYDTRQWLLRLPTRWEIRKASRPTEIAAAGVALLNRLMPTGSPDAQKGSPDQLRHARYTRTASATGARSIATKMVDIVAGGTHPAALRLSDLDTEPHLLWAGGHPYDLRRAHHDQPVDQWVAPGTDPGTPHLHSAAVTPTDTPTPLWDAFLDAVWPDPAVRAWALRVLSVSLIGHSDRVLPILLGDTSRGKTQVLVLIMSVLGTYAHAADPKLLSTAAEKAATGAILYALKGRRLSFIDEGPREGRFAQERLKQLTGGGELTADDKYAAPVTFRPTHTLVMTANDNPHLIDPALRNRVRIIPCDGDPTTVAATRAAIGPLRGTTWRAEAPGVLRQLMAEAGAYLRDPGTAAVAAAPETIRDRAEQIARDQDPVLTWLTDETDPYDPGTPSRELYAAFVGSCLRANMRRDTIPTETAWGTTLRRHGYPSRHTMHGKVRALRLRPPGGFDSPAEPATAHTQPLHDGLHDGLMTGSTTQPVMASPLVEQRISGAMTGMTGSASRAPAPAHAHAHAHENLPAPGVNPSSAPADCGATRHDGHDGFGHPTRHASTAPLSSGDGADGALVPAPSEARHPLPAAVLRDGTITPLALDQAAILTRLDDLTVDVETTGYPVGHQHHQLRTVQLGNADLAIVLDPHDPAQRQVISDALAAATVLRAHSATADLVPLDHAGLLTHGADEAWTRMHDTVLPAKLADPASTGADPGLKQLAPTVLGDTAVTPAADTARATMFRDHQWLTNIDATTDPTRSGWAQADPHSTTMLRYAGADVLDTAALAARLPTPPARVITRERAVQRMTARVTHHGLRIDPDHTATLLTEHETAAAAAEAAAKTLSGGIDNISSNQQLGAALSRLGAHLPATGTGRPSVAADTLTTIAATRAGEAADLARAVLEYRWHTKLVSTYLAPYLAQVHHGDGRIRPTIYTLAADTGRMSSVRPNIQQVPRSGGIRACITADPGELLASADFNGVELRVAAALSGDTNLAAIMADPDRDLHWEVARIAFGPDATKANRYAAKRGVFGRIYGASPSRIATAVGVTEDVAAQIVAALDQLTPQLSHWSRTLRDAVKAGQRTHQTYTGRIIHLDPDQPHKAPNYAIQGTARELLVDALLRLADTPWGHCVVVPVHDEIVLRVPADEAAAATAALVACMTGDLHGVPIVPEASEPAFAWQDSA